MGVSFESLTSKDKISSQIVSLIKNRLIDGSIKPGDKLPTEIELVEQLGVSRTPVREAMKILESIGIIEIRRGEGMFIREDLSQSNLNPLIFSLILHSNNISKLVEFRQYFEEMLIQLIRINCTEEDLQKIRQVYQSQQERMRADLSRDKLAEIDLEFHYAVLGATKNPFIIEVGKTIYEISKPQITKILDQFGVEKTLLTHKAYLDALTGKQSNPYTVVKEKIKDNWSPLEK
ncbi:FadR/GntR family transcriptional regulator [Ammoniphilus resinae]|uniref:DNA-binding FadR family transcriptional regulator n=1 Tax=Ammoniphilus resinae TaxID=861532 RepID=A0ABS4GWR8_9BACL|nr:FadR/GntR family transcriptional regulator [Ammoniphilus resinae]MBP1934708.1 DNA-binding FadR family transcriptional regulator [Ammoniphilus resinae]